MLNLGDQPATCCVPGCPAPPAYKAHLWDNPEKPIFLLCLEHSGPMKVSHYRNASSPELARLRRPGTAA